MREKKNDIKNKRLVCNKNINKMIICEGTNGLQKKKFFGRTKT